MAFQGPMKLVLASQSPRRRTLLESAGYSFRVAVSGIEEQRMDGECPDDYVTRLAREKASAVELAVDEVALGADTIVVAGGEVLEKPVDADDARRMLRLLSDRDHLVVTGICLRSAELTLVDAESTRVFFYELSDEEIDDYVASGEPMDKAGAYAIQGLASRFIPRVEGCYLNVVGLPVARLYRMFGELRERQRVLAGLPPAQR